MQLITSFNVVGRPAPQGSKVSLGRGRFKESSKYLDAWRNDVRNAAGKAFGEALVAGPLLTDMVFMFSRPKCHHISSNLSRPLKDGAPFWHTSTPDCDKLQRSTNDALTGIIWEDDSQVCATLSQKIYAEPETPSGAIIHVYRLSEQELADLVKF
jgi:Holliday junction resolvase RusA-like endonuclease